MRTAQAATRLRVDRSRVVHFLNHGLVRRGLTPLYLRGTVITDPKSGRRRWEISPEAVTDFRRSRKAAGLS